MRYLLVLIAITAWSFHACCQQGKYEGSIENPYGLLNPNAPVEVGDYADLIGRSSCHSIKRNPDGSWQDTVRMVWTFKYILDGFAVQDYSIKDDGTHTSSIRQYQPDSARWYVTFFPKINPPANPGVWSGNKEDNGDIVLYKPHPLPNGTSGTSRLTFKDISSESFNWVGEWISLDKNIQFPFWKLHCQKTE